MSDKIGVLGEASTLTVASTTVYTVPSGKAAKGKLFYRCQAGAGGTTTLTISINGIVVFEKGATTASHYIYSTSTAEMITGAAAPTGATTALTAAAGPNDYYLSAGDVVSYTVGGEALLAASFQFVGAEVDAA